MKTRLLLSSFLLTFCCFCTLEAKDIKGNGNVSTREYPVNEYHTIAIGKELSCGESSFWGLFSSHSNDGINCHYSQQEKASLQITADENLLEHISVEVEEGQLTVKSKNNDRLIPTQLKITTGSKQLEKVVVSAGINFYLETQLNGSSLIVIASGGSDINMKKPVHVDFCKSLSSGGSDIYFDDLTCNRLICESSGGSDTHIKGKADEAEMRASGGSYIKAFSFIVKQLICSASGGADIYANASEYLKANASGGSDIHYKGDARVESSSSGGSDIYKE